MGVAADEKDAAFIELFSGETAPTADQVAQYAEENELDIEEVFQKINTMLHDLLVAKEAEEEEAEAGEEVTEAEDPAHEAGETPEEEEEEHESGDEAPDEMPAADSSDEFPFEVGDVVSCETDNPDNMFFGKKLDVVNTQNIGNGDGFVQVVYVDEDGEETTVWFRIGEVKLEEKGGASGGDTEELGPEEPGEEPEGEESEGEEEEEEEEKNESYGILYQMKSMGLYSLNG
jgi:hypothetical protein